MQTLDYYPLRENQAITLPPTMNASPSVPPIPLRAERYILIPRERIKQGKDRAYRKCNNERTQLLSCTRIQTIGS